MSCVCSHQTPRAPNALSVATEALCRTRECVLADAAAGGVWRGATSTACTCADAVSLCRSVA
eukprot:1510071-Rhodomonas_salina.1